MTQANRETVKALSSLTEREAKVIRERFGFEIKASHEKPQKTKPKIKSKVN